MIKVLIVDDQNSGRCFLRSIFSQILDVSSIVLATNGREAISMVEEHNPDIVVMDIKMPIMNGIEATKIISQQFKHTKVILITSYDDTQTRILAIEAGANAFVNKANDLQCLDRVISLVVKGYEYFQFERIGKIVGESDLSEETSP